jgi:uncharacterized protein
MADRPGTLLAASAVGYYGSRADQTLTEESSAGEGFLADVCRQWEAATDPARQVGIRVVNLRLGVVLSARDGALRKMLGPFKLGLGGRVGHGRQWMSWVVLEDVVRAFDRAMGQAGLSGPVNVCSPQPVTNAGFTRALGRALHRPTMLPVPAWVVGALLGQMGRETLLSSARVLPARLTAAGFTFKHEQIDEALGAAIRS